MVKGYFFIITRAVYIELTPDLSVKSFLLAFRNLFRDVAYLKILLAIILKHLKLLKYKILCAIYELNGILSWKSPHGGTDFMRGWYVQLRTL